MLLSTLVFSVLAFEFCLIVFCVFGFLYLVVSLIVCFSCVVFDDLVVFTGGFLVCGFVLWFVSDLCVCVIQVVAFAGC